MFNIIVLKNCIFVSLNFYLFEFLDVMNVESATISEIKLKWKDESNSCPPEDYFVTINGEQKRGKRLIEGKWSTTDFSVTLNSKNQIDGSGQFLCQTTNEKC